MLGHTLVPQLAKSCYTIACVRSLSSPLPSVLEAHSVETITGIDLTAKDAIHAVIDRAQPDTIVNCAGLIKQRAEAADTWRLRALNTDLPKTIAERASRESIRLIHVSTDCVFSGKRGSYTEDDIPDPIDEYGRSKAAGELLGSTSLVLRTSFVGRQLKGNESLIEWFLATQAGVVRGYSSAFFSGLTAPRLAQEIARIALNRPDLRGLYHVGGPRISKFDLLCLLARTFKKEIEIEEDSSVVIDRSLDSSKYSALTGYASPPWEEMISELEATSHNYQTWRA
jgi:dTDP-4-dehydrorhamnose reductase